MLKARPMRNTKARAERHGSDRVSVYVKRTRPKTLVPPLSWIVPFKPERRTVLDRLGTQIWDLCDGHNTVEQIVDCFAERHKLSFHEARVAVTGYIKNLVGRGALAMAMREEV